MTRKTRTEIEEISLNNVNPLLKKIYGDFNWVDEISDRPDAAIKTSEGKMVGIEIIQIDNEKYLKRSNTWKKSKKELEKINQINTRLLVIPEKLGKRICINKNVKLSQYKKIRHFDEFILLMITENLPLVDNVTTGYYREHFLYALEGALLRNRLKYDKSIITHRYSGVTEIVTDGNIKTRTRPSNFRASDWNNGCHHIDCSIMQFAAFAGEVCINFSPDKILPA